MILRWFKRLFSRSRLDIELEKELRFHVESRTLELIEAGTHSVEARRRALAEFGGMDPARENTRDARGTRWIEDTLQDVRYAFRMLRMNKGFTAAAVLSLAVGIGANAAVFRVIDGLVFYPLQVHRPNELFLVESTLADSSRFSHPAYLQLAEAAKPAAFAAMTRPTTMQITVNGNAELRTAQLVSGNWFSFLGIGAHTGRVLTPSDDTVQIPQAVIVISDGYWTRQYGRSLSALGSTILVNNMACTIVGVAAAGFTGVTVGLPVDLWLPISMQHAVHYQGNASTNNADVSRPWVPQDGVSWLALMGRADESVSRTGLLSALDGRYRQIIEERITGIQDENRRARQQQDRIRITDASRGISTLRRQLSPALTVLMSMVGLVLLVACANLANLLLARGTARTRELALRLSIGARRGRLIRQLLTESLTLATLGGAAGFAAAWWGARGLLQLVSTSSTPVPVTLPVDWRVVLFGIGATLLTGLLFGLVPALRLSRPAIQESLKSGGRVVDAAHRSRFPLIKVLVVVQVAVSVLLLAGAALFFQTFQNLVRIDTGFDRERVLTARFDTRLSGIAEADLPALYRSMIEEVSRIPGVQSVTIGVTGPVTGTSRISGVSIDRYVPPPDEDTSVHEEFAGANYFSTLGIRLISGRDFTEYDDERAPQVAIINETMAKRYFGGGSPLGRTFGYGNTTDFQVVGVASDVRSNGLRSDIPPMAYYPLRQRPDEYARNLYIRANGPVQPLTAALRQALKTAAPGVAVREVLTLGELTERTVSAERLVSRLAALFGLLGVAVACFGLYGTITYSVSRRTGEIGVRLALGASPTNVRWMVLHETLVLVTLGVLAGIGLVLALGRLAETQLYGLSPRDPLTLSITSVAVIAVGLISGALPAWRASNVSPTIALRQDA